MIPLVKVPVSIETDNEENGYNQRKPREVPGMLPNHFK
jgi:hypothetical protein